MSDQTFGKAARAYWDELEGNRPRLDRIGELIILTERDATDIWHAFDDASEYGPIGFGKTEQAAIDDLISQL
jgi:hypothetical protein